MRLKNRRTGEVKEVIVGGYPVSGKTKMWECSEVDTNEETGYKSLGTYTSLAELNEEWEDYEEPKDTNYWCINSLGKIEFHSTVLDEIDGTPNNAMIRKIIGNYFDTREEARQAVEKLKAWKRLKDDGITYSLDEGDGTPYVIIHSKEEKGPVQKVLRVLEDLTLLFGGEE